MVNDAIRISVVIPAKNRAHTLARCLASVLVQSYPAHEIIVVDDGSTDATRALVEGYGAPVRYVRLPHGKGAQAARNHGVRVAEGAWIAFQDSDDVWFPDKLAMQVEALRARAFDAHVLVHADGVRRDEASGDQQPLCVPFTAGRCHAQLLLRPAPLFQTLLVSKQAILEAGGLDDGCPSYQEWDSAIRLARVCEFIHIQRPVFIWIWHAGQTISKDLRREVTGFDYVIKQHKAEILAVHGARAWRRLLATNVLRAMDGGYWDEAAGMLTGEGHAGLLGALTVLGRVRRMPRGLARGLRLMAKLS